MKSETKKNPAQAFAEENRFVKRVIIHQKNRTTFFPEPEAEKKRYFEEMITLQKENTSGSHLFFLTPEACVYMYKKDKAVFICECDCNISVSQVKMEFDAFVEESQKQGKFPKFFSSFFDR